MEDLEIIFLKSDDSNFEQICNYCEENITFENLAQNGGTLNYSGLTYNSEILVVALSNNVPIGYNSLVFTYDEKLYIYQIAVKKDYKKLGVGSALMKAAIEIANERDMDISAHVREYNIASKAMFESLGFKKIEQFSTPSNNFYLLKQKDIRLNDSEEDLKSIK